MGNIAATWGLGGNGRNPLINTIGRNEDGEITVDLGRFMKQLHGSAKKSTLLADMVKTLGEGPVSESALRNYSATYKTSSGGDADLAGTMTYRPFKTPFKGLFNQAVELFEIKEKGQKEAARIAQEGRDKARQTNFGAELESINRRALAASEDSAREQAGGNPDVVLSTDTDADAGLAGQGETARRRRSSYFSGGGLKI